MPNPPTQPDADQAKRNPRWRKPLRAAIGFAVLVALVLFNDVQIANVWQAITAAHWPYLLGAACLAVLMQWATADRLKRLCVAHGHGWSTLEIFQINLATRFYGLFLPGGNFTGIAIRFYKLTGDHKHYLGTAVALFYDRIAATVTLCALGAGFWLAERPDDSWQALAAILAALLVMVCALLILFGKSPGRLVTRLRHMAGRVGGVKLHTLRQAVRESRSLSARQMFYVYSLSVGAHLLGVVGWYLLSESLGLGLSLTTVGWVRTAMILATMIPISVAGLGLREGAALLLLTTYPGVENEDAIAFSFLVFIVTTLLVGLMGGLIEGKRVLGGKP
jgi:glycosyltransferase 2 family protein